jgi:hypothetical protein
VLAFDVIKTLNPRPDHVYVITDGLPTQGRKPESGNVSGRERLKFFDEATEALPRGLPINVILMPMEGDPKAASAYWQLALVTGGTYMNPSKDWP